jgi:hypothetical protein
VRLQASLFTPGLQFRSGKILAHFLAKWPEVFSGEPTTLPVPPEAPPEIPHLLLRSETGEFLLQAAPIKLDVLWTRQSMDSDLNVTQYLHWVSELFPSYLEVTGGNAGRLACIATRMARNEAPALTLSRHFCQPRWTEAAGPLNRPCDFELHAHKQFLLAQWLDVNSWVRCKTGLLRYGDQTTPTQTQVIIVEQDLNTLAEEMNTREFGPEDITRFYELMPQELEQILILYFPDGGANG